MLTAGAPRSAGRDAERMLRTAHEIAGFRGALAIRVGVNAGHVCAGDFGRRRGAPTRSREMP